MDNKQAIKLVEQGYNKIYRNYNKNRQMKNDKALIVKFAESFTRNAKVLDVGCGSGKVAALLSNYGLRVIGIDISKNMLKLAKENSPKSRFYLMNMKDMNFPTKSFDGVISLYAIIHLPRRYHYEVLKRMYKFLKPGGKLLISVGRSDSKEWFEENWHGGRMYWSHFSRKKNEDLIANAGFKIKHSYVIGSPNDKHVFIFAGKPASKNL
ncbi:MAG: class I SAM-dependent methyltransferase [Candidatus Micrarchaeota archaeon]|nr:class I SAM-dependent methyltransferase [Candidatus Micrarchaeota archaeon]